MSNLSRREWHAAARQAIVDLANSGVAFDAYALSRVGVPDPSHPNLWGSAFRSAAADGLIREVGYHQSQRPGRARGACRLWKGSNQ